MKFCIAWPFGWALFWIGHAASRYVYWVNDRQVAKGAEEVDWDKEPDLVFRAAWRVYQQCMIWSGDISDWGKAEIWHKPPTEEEKQEIRELLQTIHDATESRPNGRGPAHADREK